ncbi:MAG: PqqD family peptide modification chaperone [Phycisphaerales bacterium]|nr:MAG: PqqD family peptide modification chaperone [Phycisphaerales bacterium]
MIRSGILRDDPASTFSDVWYRVAPTRPRLSPHATITPQRFGPKTDYVVDDPATAKFYRLSGAAYLFAAMLDGRRTVDDAWQTACARLGDDAPTQKECVDLLAKLQSFGLLLGELPLSPEMVHERRTRARKSRIQRRTGKWFFFTIPLINPEPVLHRTAWLCRAVFSKPMGIVFLLVLAAGLFSVLTNIDRMGDPLSNILEPASLALITITFLVLRGLHELGHAAACKAMGGRCTEIGVILIALILPLPYCDASAAWRFRSLSARVLVSGAGILVEIFIAAVAAVIWANAPAEQALLRTLCFNVMLVASATTLLFNLNPLLRYDGYYILSDLLGVPNLQQRSKELWQFFFERLGFGVRERPPAVRSRGEAWALGVFAALSFPYRIFILFAIVLLISTQYLTIGIALAVVAIAIMGVWPILKLIGYLAGSPKLSGHRARAVGVSLGALAIGVVALGLVPAPAAVYAAGAVEARRDAPVRVPESGYIDRVLVAPGQAVALGEPLFELRSPELRADVRTAEAGVMGALANLDAAAINSPAAEQIARGRLHVYQATLERLEERADALTVRAPVAGRFIAEPGTNPPDLVGLYADRGVKLGRVATTDDPIVRAFLADRDHAYAFGTTRPVELHPASATTTPAEPASNLRRVAYRVRGDAGRVVPARLLRTAPVGSRDLENPALATAVGGDVRLDPNDPDQRRTLTPQFLIELEPETANAGVGIGQRARVRLDLPRAPLAAQWWRRAMQYLESRQAGE